MIVETTVPFCLYPVKYTNLVLFYFVRSVFKVLETGSPINSNVTYLQYSLRVGAPLRFCPSLLPHAGVLPQAAHPCHSPVRIYAIFCINQPTGNVPH